MEIVSFLNMEAEHQVKSTMSLCLIPSARRGDLQPERALIHLPDVG